MQCLPRNPTLHFATAGSPPPPPLVPVERQWKTFPIDPSFTASLHQIELLRPRHHCTVPRSTDRPDQDVGSVNLIRDTSSPLDRSHTHSFTSWIGGVEQKTLEEEGSFCCPDTDCEVDGKSQKKNGSGKTQRQINRFTFLVFPRHATFRLVSWATYYQSVHTSGVLLIDTVWRQGFFRHRIGEKEQELCVSLSLGCFLSVFRDRKLHRRLLYSMFASQT